MTDTSTDVIDNGSDNSQNDDVMTRLDAKKNQQTQESQTLFSILFTLDIIHIHTHMVFLFQQATAKLRGYPALKPTQVCLIDHWLCL